MISTDDAYVQADVATLGIKVAGYVAEVAVKDGDTVKAGDVLVKLDDTDYALALDSASGQARDAERHHRSHRPAGRRPSGPDRERQRPASPPPRPSRRAPRRL